MFKTNTRQLISRRINFNHELSRFINSKTDDTNIDRFKNELKSGPQLSDFIRDDKWSDYSGKLKRGSGDNER